MLAIRLGLVYVARVPVSPWRRAKVTSQDNQTATVALEAIARAAKLLDEYMTEEELAAELDVDKRTLRRWHRTGIGPPRVTIARKLYYRRSGAADWIRSQERSF